MIEIKPDEAALNRIAQEIGGVSYKAPTILKDAANATGKYAVNLLKKGIRRRYGYRDSDINLQEHLKRKSATYQNPRTVITSRGTMTRLSNFNVTPRRLSRGANRVGPYAASVLRENAPAVLSNRTFMVQFKSGHIAVVQRVPGKRYTAKSAIAERTNKHLDLTKIEELRSPSVAHMTNVVFGREEKHVGDKLQQNIGKRIEKYFERGK